MKILKTIKDKDLGMDYPDPEIYLERTAARGIIFDKDNKIALLYTARRKYHKIPGGGVDEGEDIIEGLKREMKEEIGCEITNIKEIGIIEEIMNNKTRHQLSHYFRADVLGEKGVPNLEEDEIENGISTMWVSLDEAIDLIKNDNQTQNYMGKFIQARDLFILEELKSNIL